MAQKQLWRLDQWGQMLICKQNQRGQWTKGRLGGRSKRHMNITKFICGNDKTGSKLSQWRSMEGSWEKEHVGTKQSSHLLSLVAHGTMGHAWMGEKHCLEGKASYFFLRVLLESLYWLMASSTWMPAFTLSHLSTANWSFRIIQALIQGAIILSLNFSKFLCLLLELLILTFNHMFIPKWSTNQCALIPCKGAVMGNTEFYDSLCCPASQKTVGEQGLFYRQHTFSLLKVYSFSNKLCSHFH
jgi:hypothetical protein